MAWREARQTLGLAVVVGLLFSLIHPRESADIGNAAHSYFSNASATSSAGSVGIPTAKAMYCLPFTI